MLRFRRRDRRADDAAWRTTLTDIADWIRRALAALLWLVAVVAISLGAAGIVAGMDTPAADGRDRSGRINRGDAIVNASLDHIEGLMRDLSGVIGTLNGQARVILASLSSNETAAADEATALGTSLVSDIEWRAGLLRDALDQVPIVGAPTATYEISPATRERYDGYVGGLEATSGIGNAWTRLTVASLSASRLSALLASHDEAVVEAARDGRRADYDAALEHLDDADAAIASAKALRDRLAATIDVTTLDQWLNRSADYDVALRALYEAVSGGAGNEAIRRAMQAEAAAKERLPPDTRSLVLIMSDIGQGGMNAAAIEIEQAGADLDEALARPLAEPAPAP